MKTRYFKDNNKYFNFINKNKLIKVLKVTYTKNKNIKLIYT